MTGLVDVIRGELDERCLVTRVKKSGCKVAMTGAPSPRLIVDFDKPGSPLPPSSVRCDYLLIAKGPDDCGWVVPLELKRGRLEVNQVVGQLQAGASAAEKLVPQDEACRFRPVVAVGNVPKSERQKLKEKANKIGFHRHKEPVRLMHCGDKLAKVLRQ